jgi:hypothetical protein
MLDRTLKDWEAGGSGNGGIDVVSPCPHPLLWTRPQLYDRCAPRWHLEWGSTRRTSDILYTTIYQGALRVGFNLHLNESDDLAATGYYQETGEIDHLRKVHCFRYTLQGELGETAR